MWGGVRWMFIRLLGVSFRLHFDGEGEMLMVCVFFF